MSNAPLNAADIARIPALLAFLDRQLHRERAVVKEQCRIAGIKLDAAARAWPEVQSKMDRLDDLAVTILVHRDAVCPTRLEDCALLVPHLAHYATHPGMPK